MLTDTPVRSSYTATTAAAASERRLARFTIVFSGLRDPELIEKIRSQGGIYLASWPVKAPTRQVILVVKSVDRETAKLQTARAAGAKIMTVDQFTRWLSGQRVSSGDQKQLSPLLQKVRKLNPSLFVDSGFNRLARRARALSKIVDPEVYLVLGLLNLWISPRLNKPLPKPGKGLLNQVTGPDIRIQALTWKADSATKKMLALIKNRVLFKRNEFTYSPKKGFKATITGGRNGMTVARALKGILDVERTVRNQPGAYFMGGPDVHHIYFESLFYNARTRTWGVFWGS